jgi:hypothetical protein
LALLKLMPAVKQEDLSEKGIHGHADFYIELIFID